MIKKFISCCVKTAISISISLLLLSLFTIFYSHSGVHITNETGATDYKWEANQYKATMSEGFSWIRMNAEGFNNSLNASDVNNIDILLMGSSHMEAVNVSKNKSTVYLLNSVHLAKLFTYNIGMSGHTIYHCVKNLKRTIKTYNPSHYIIIETSTIDLDEVKMSNVINDTFPMIPSYDTGIIYKLQKYVPCFLPLYRELSNWIAVDSNSHQESNANKANARESHSADYVDILNAFLAKIVKSADTRKVIILYHPETVFDDSGALKPEDIELVKLFQEACDRHSIEFIDLYDDFRSEYEKNHRIAHGFINTRVGSGHLNETGHKLAAECLGATIKRLEYGTE